MRRKWAFLDSLQLFLLPNLRYYKNSYLIRKTQLALCYCFLINNNKVPSLLQQEPQQTWKLHFNIP